MTTDKEPTKTQDKEGTTGGGKQSYTGEGKPVEFIKYGLGIIVLLIIIISLLAIFN